MKISIIAGKLRFLIVISLFNAGFLQLLAQDRQEVQAEHGMIGNSETKSSGMSHTTHPDAQWYPDASLGLFVHWGISSVKSMNISWTMIPGRALANVTLDSAEIRRIVSEKDYNLTKKPPVITPNEYWSMAKEFNPRFYDPEKWIKAAKEAGFTYVVLTTKHHEGFALWPSKYGNFNTKNYMGGRDLIKPFVDACRKYGLKVGLYYSPPDWYFDRAYMNFLYYRGPMRNPGLPSLDADLNPRTSTKTPLEIEQHQKEYGAYVRGQIEEILTRWGKIDLIWFDGKAPVSNGNNLITQDEIRKLQPGILINPRMHGKGDFVTFERTMPTKSPGKVWAEFCDPWTGSWSHSDNAKFRSNAFVLGELATCRSNGINFLLGVGPTADGTFCDDVFSNMKVVENWMKLNGNAVKEAGVLPQGEKASVPATAYKNIRYLFAIPEFKKGGKYEKDRLPAQTIALTLETRLLPKSAVILGSGVALKFHCQDNKVVVDFPAELRSDLVDVVKIEFKN